MTFQNDLPPIQRLITTTNKDGKAVFDTSVPTEAAFHHVGTAGFFLGYATSSFPPSIDSGEDISTYKHYMEKPPGLVIPGGTVLRVVDCAPGSKSPFHKTVSLDYGIILEGEVDLVLDDGVTKRMRRGDIAVQRATMHGWNNPTDKWARIVFILQECKGSGLTEDYGVGMDGVKPSAS